jgi:hypothetical protein
VAELTAEDADIHWSVHLANKKAAWFEYQLAQDIPEASSAPPQLLRNSSVADRASLVIDPGPRRISGRGTHGGKAHVFDTGSFLGEPVYLGELRTDDHGRLLVLGGHGKSRVAREAPRHHVREQRRLARRCVRRSRHRHRAPRRTIAACRTGLGGRGAAQLRPAPAVGPHDVGSDARRRDQSGIARGPKRPSLQEDIQPIFDRLARLQWVNAGFAAAFGWRGSLDVVDADRIRELSRNTDDARDAAGR